MVLTSSQASGGPRIPSAQVQAHLRRLEEIASREELDEARALALLLRMRHRRSDPGSWK